MTGDGRMKDMKDMRSESKKENQRNSKEVYRGSTQEK